MPGDQLLPKPKSKFASRAAIGRLILVADSQINVSRLLILQSSCTNRKAVRPAILGHAAEVAETPEPAGSGGREPKQKSPNESPYNCQ